MMSLSNRKQRARRRLGSLFLTFSLIASIFSGSFETISAADKSSKAKTQTITGNDLLNIDNQTPSGEDPKDNSNPYGLALGGDGRLSVAFNELSVLTQGLGSDPNYNEVKYYGKYPQTSQTNPLTPFQDKADGASGRSVGYAPYNYARGVAYNGGSGRDRFTAYVGYEHGSGNYKIWTVDSQTGKVVADIKVQAGGVDVNNAEKAVITFTDGDLDYYEAINFLDIVAGDFDGDGKDEIIVAVSLLQYINKSSDGMKIVLYEYKTDNNGNVFIAASKQVYQTTSEDEHKTVSLAAGYINNDSVEDFALVLGATGTPGESVAKAVVKGFYGVKATAGKGRDLNSYSYFDDITLYGTIKDNGNNISATISSPGIAIGDLDGDQLGEIIVAGYQYRNESGKFKARKAQMMAVYQYSLTDKKLHQKIYTATSMNDWITSGFYTNDDIHPRAAVSTVSFNGPGKAAYIFFNGDIYEYAGYDANNSSFNSTFTPDYFTHATDDYSNMYIEDIAVGNFTQDEVGREQIYYAVALKYPVGGQQTGEYYTHEIGMIGATYGTDDEASIAAAARPSFFGTGVERKMKLYDAWYDNHGQAYPTHVILSACDRNEDGVKLRYHKADTVLLITAAPATKRAVRIFSELSGESPVYLSVDIQHHQYYADSWIFNRESRKNWLHEWAALAHSHWDLLGTDTLEAADQTYDKRIRNLKAEAEDEPFIDLSSLQKKDLPEPAKDTVAKDSVTAKPDSAKVDTSKADTPKDKGDSAKSAPEKKPVAKADSAKKDSAKK